MGQVKDQGQRCPRCEPTQRENQRLRKQVRELSNKLEQLEQDKQKLRQQHERDQQEISQLKGLLEKQRRAGKRQAAPFSRGKPKKDPTRPGRKRGSAYGPKAHRPVPERVDQILDGPLPDRCPDCDGAVEESHVVAQYQIDLPPKIEPCVTQFNVHVGHCVRCNRRLQGRHPLQTSDALGAAASQVGPRALALAAELKVAGLSFGKLSGLFAKIFGISITPGGLCQGLHRLAQASEPTYEALKDEVRNAACVTPDETGWRVGGLPAWFWVYVTIQVTVYVVEPGRGFDQAAKVLGEDFSGSLVRDGWAPYRRFQLATHQSCLNHLLNRCDEILETAQRGAARFPHAVKRLLNQALSLRERRDQGKISPHGLAVATGRLRAAMNRLLAWRPRNEENRRFAKHLRTEQTALFTFLERPEVPATNHLAERALRPPVATRKNCGGGNRTWKGASTLAKIASVFRTALQQGLDPAPIFVSLLHSPKPTVAHRLLPGADLDGSARSPPPSP